MVILSTQTTASNSRLHDMQGLTLPPVNNKIYLNSVTTRKPPSRSWSRFKKLLIDTPKDSNLLQRQKLWNFQKLNRGAFRSQITSLPDIPYRVHTNSVDKVSVGVQTGPSYSFNSSLRVIFPNLTARDAKVQRDDNSDDDGEDEGDTKDKACSPMHLDDSDEYSNDFEDESDVDDPYYEFDTVIRKKDAGTMTDVKKSTTKHAKKKEKRKRTVKERHSKKEHQSILIQSDRSKRSNSAHKNVKFKHLDVVDDSTQTPDIPDVTPPMIERIEIEKIRPVEKEETIEEQQLLIFPTPEPSPVPTVFSPPVPKLESLHQENTDFSISVDIGNIGHSSHRSLESLSVLDYLSGARTDRPRYGDNKRQYNSDRNKDGHSKMADADADRQWFEQIVGDKDIVDLSSYENFARVRPNVESHSDSNADRYTDMGKAAPVKKGGYTPRINGEPPVSRTQQYLAGLAAKQEAALAAVNNKSKPSKRNMINIGKSY